MTLPDTVVWLQSAAAVLRTYEEPIELSAPKMDPKTHAYHCCFYTLLY